MQNRVQQKRLKAIMAAINRTAIVLHKKEWQKEIMNRFLELQRRLSDNTTDVFGDPYIYADEEFNIIRTIVRNLPTENS